MNKHILSFFISILTFITANCQSIWDNYVGPFEDGLAKVELNGKYGFIDKSGKIVIPCIYENWDIYFSDDLASVKLNGKYGCIDKTGKLIIKCLYESPLYFSEGLACIKINGKHGYIDKTGKLAIPCIYEIAYNFCEGLALVLFNDLWGYIDKNNNIKIPFKFKMANPFNNGFAAVSITNSLTNNKDLLYGFINKKGNLIFPQKLIPIIPSGKAYTNGTYISQFHDSVCIVSDSQNILYLLNAKGEMYKIDSKYNFEYTLGYSYPFREGLAVMQINGKFGFVDKHLNLVIPCVFDRAESFSEGFAGVQINGKVGFIDRSGKLQIAFIYDVGPYYPSFDEGLACVLNKGKYGAINKSGTTIIPFEYDDYGSFYFSDGLALTFKNRKRCFIDTSNKCVLNCN